MANNDSKNAFFYPIMVVSGVLTIIATFVTNLQAIYSALGLAASMVLIGIGILGWFVSERKIYSQTGIFSGIIWILLILVIALGYYAIVDNPVSISGYLFDDNLNRNPVANYQIELYHYPTGNTSRVKTDANGNFRFEDIPDGEYDIIINGEIVRSEEAESGIQKLMEGNIDAGRFYLNNLGGNIQIATLSTPTDTPTLMLPPTIADTPTKTHTPTNEYTLTPSHTPTTRPTQTPRPTSPPTPTFVPGTVLADEDFEDNENQEFRIQGLWTYEVDETGNRVFESNNLNSHDPNYITFGSNSWTNYSIEYKFRILDHKSGYPEIAVYFRNEGIENSYRKSYLQSILTDYGGEIILATSNNASGSWVRLTTSQIAIENHTWYSVKIIAQGSHFEVYVNDLKYIETENSTFTRGTIMFEILSGTHAQFDDIKIIALE